MKASCACIELIKEFEGLVNEPYVCPAGKITIGYGHVIKPGELFDKVTENDAEEILKNDIEDAENAVVDIVEVEITQNQFDALVSFIYNIGAHAFRKSTMLRLLNFGEYEKAAAQFDRWIYAGGHKLEGLVRRRKAERELFELTN